MMKTLIIALKPLMIKGIDDETLIEEDIDYEDIDYEDIY